MATITITDNPIVLHGLDGTPISVPKADIVRLVAIADHPNFPEIKTQVILTKHSLLCSPGGDHWLYVRETVSTVNTLIDQAK